MRIRQKKVLVSDYLTVCPKKNLLKLFFFNFTTDKIPNLPQADSDDFTGTIHVYKCKNRDGNDVIKSLLLSTQFKNILQGATLVPHHLKIVSFLGKDL